MPIRAHRSPNPSLPSTLPSAPALFSAPIAHLPCYYASSRRSRLQTTLNFKPACASHQPSQPSGQRARPPTNFPSLPVAAAVLPPPIQWTKTRTKDGKKHTLFPQSICTFHICTAPNPHRFVPPLIPLFHSRSTLTGK